MNRRGFLAVLLGTPIAAKMAPEAKPTLWLADRSGIAAQPIAYHYTQPMRIPFGWREKDGRRVDGVLFNYDGVDRKTYRG